CKAICAGKGTEESLALGTKTGYKLFSLTTVEKLDCIHESAETPDVYIVERLFSSSLVVVVSTTMPQRMNVYHFKKGTEICNYSYPNNILAVKLNRQRLVVCLEESIYVHNIKDMKLLKTLLNTPSNPSGLCALSVNHSNSYLAYPGSATIGEIIVYDANNLVSYYELLVALLQFVNIATCYWSVSTGHCHSSFSIPEGQRLFEFRRGMKRYVNISSLSFSPDGQFLCASSNTETVHIFKLEQLGPRGRGCHLDSLHGEDVLSSQQLPPCSGIWYDEPGPGLRHRPPPLIWPEERLHPGYDPEASTAACGHSQRPPVHLQRGSTGRRRVHVGSQTQVRVSQGLDGCLTFG
uniref:WD repeat domain, phosphoinositide interacting 1 n=1 Tax=Lates calcarifer TaxID=8187 RepID=A0A4W6D490_LATCA